jgi:hypothetical protein
MTGSHHYKCGVSLAAAFIMQIICSFGGTPLVAPIYFPNKKHPISFLEIGCFAF